MPLGQEQFERSVAAQPVDISAGVSVVRLDLTRFRNYREARLEIAGRVVVLTGPNGAGKTNLLEAVSFLAPGRGLRRARLTDIDHRSEGDVDESHPWAVSARLVTPHGAVAVGTGRHGGDGSDRRVVRIDGEAAKSQVALGRLFNVVWLTPQMDRLFIEGASARRRFLDRLVFGFDPDHAGRLTAYEGAQKERARLLQEGAGDASWLAVLEETMAREGAALAAARRDVARRLDEAASGARSEMPFPRPILSLDGGAEDWLASCSTDYGEARLRDELRGARRLDAQTGTTTIGPHRTDFVVRHGVHATLAAECSTGEQKALLVSIVLAHARLQAELRGVAPVLLLDEVAAHLDRSRRDALYEVLSGLGSQVWMTGTDPELFAPLEGHAQFVPVEQGSFGTPT